MRTLLVPAFIALFATHSNAQGLGYVIAGPAGRLEGVNDPITVHAAAGGEFVAADRVGVGGELGFFYRFITGSANATLHLGRVRSGNTTPFVTAGYSSLWRVDGETAFRAFSVGAGVDIWPAENAGFRVELRDHLRRDNRGTTHYWSARAGMVFR